MIPFTQTGAELVSCQFQIFLKSNNSRFKKGKMDFLKSRVYCITVKSLDKPKCQIHSLRAGNGTYKRSLILEGQNMTLFLMHFPPNSILIFHRSVSIKNLVTFLFLLYVQAI